jgi:Big-like domain-containing protein
VKRLAVLGVLGALAAAGSGVGMSSAAFTAKSQSTATIGAAADWVAPAVSVSSPADGARLRSGSVTVFGPAGTDDGDSSSISLSLYSGSNATGSPALTRTASRLNAYWYTSLTSLADGTYTLLATQTDNGGNTGRATRTFTVDTTAPTHVSLTAENASGNSGRLDMGDTITFTFSEAIDPGSILSGWSGDGAATVKVRFLNNVASSTDGFTVLDSGGAATVKLDTAGTKGAGVTLGSGANYVSGTVNFTGTMTQSADGKSVVIVLGSNDSPSRVSTSQASSAKLSWTPTSGPTDLAGNGLANTNTWTETTSARHF